VYVLNVPGTVSAEEELGVEIVEATGVTHAGWSNVDPDGWACMARQWATPGVESALAAGALVTVDAGVHTRSLSVPTVDQLLLWMEKRGLGRPSTFSAHIEALLSGTSTYEQAAESAQAAVQ
jgi:DNA topoisomerase IA